MSREDAEQLLDRWMNDPGFKGQMRADPVGAARGIGAMLDGDDVAALQSIDWTLSDEELTERISKAFSRYC